MSKSEKLRNIRDNRAAERSALRKEEGFELAVKSSANTGKKAEVVDFADGKKRKNQSDYEDEILELLKRERDERLGRRK